MKDLQARQSARTRLDVNMVVEAGAGTGKTTLLIDRLLFLVLAGGAGKKGIPMDRVVALTFTEKAAGEIKIRLAAQLNEVVSFLGTAKSLDSASDHLSRLIDDLLELTGRPQEEIRHQAEEALSKLDRAQIGTIHHFASHILKLFPVESNVSPDFEVDPGPAFRQLFESEWVKWLEWELGDSPPRASQWLEILPLLALEDLMAVAFILCQQGASPDREKQKAIIQRSFHEFVEEFSSLAQDKPNPGSRSRIPQVIAEVTGHLRKLEGELRSEKASLHPPLRLSASKWPKAWETLEGESVYKKGVSLASTCSVGAENFVEKALSLLDPFVKSFREVYSNHGHIGFDGLLLQARNVIRDNIHVRKSLKGRYDAFLIDEFQDTDPLQGEILLYLTAQNEGRLEKWEDIFLEPGKLFVVGDPKQSIYRFRGADIRAYQKFTQLIVAQGGVRCHLQTNFRSRPALIQWVNGVFSKIMKEKTDHQPAYTELFERPKGTESPEAAAIQWVLVEEEKEKLSMPQSQGLEARWICQWIEDHCLKKDPPYALKDVTLLFRTTSAINLYVDVFKRRGIPYVIESDRSFYGTQEVIDFLNLLRVLDNGENTLAWVGLLRSPFVGMSDHEIQELKQAGYLQSSRNKRKPLSFPSFKRFTALQGLLERVRSQAARLPLGELIAILLRDSFFMELCVSAYHGEQTLSNIHKFSRIAFESGDDFGLSLKEFIAKVGRSVGSSIDEGESPLADEHLDAVHFVTVHKAKGLEYPVVFLPSLSSVPGRGNDNKAPLRVDWSSGIVGTRFGQSKVTDLPMALIELEEKERESSEWIRLLYVALTRAKERIFLLGREDYTPTGSFASFLGQAGFWPSSAEAEPPVRIKADDAPSTAPLKVKNEQVLSVLGASAKSCFRRGEYWKQINAQPLFEAPSLLDSAYPPLKKSKKSKGQVISQGNGRLVGTLCHRVLQKWDYQRDSWEKIAQYIQGAHFILSQEGALGRWEESAEEAEALLRLFLKSDFYRRVAASEIVGREVPFIHPKGDRVLRGSIDLMYREEGKLWLADYKTDRLDPSEAEVLAQHYRPQGEAYQDAVQGFSGEKSGFQVVFLRTGQVVDLSFPSQD